MGGHIVGLKIYPIKGCGALRVRRWPLDPRTGGFFLDRRWCLQLAGSSAKRPTARGASKNRSLQVSAKQAPGLTRVRFAITDLRSSRPELVLSVAGLCGGSATMAPFRLPLSSDDAALLLDCGAEVEADLDLDSSSGELPPPVQKGAAAVE